MRFKVDGTVKDTIVVKLIKRNEFDKDELVASYTFTTEAARALGGRLIYACDVQDELFSPGRVRARREAAQNAAGADVDDEELENLDDEDL